MSRNLYAATIALVIALASWVWLQLTQATDQLTAYQREILYLRNEVQRISSLQATLQSETAAKLDQQKRPPTEVLPTSTSGLVTPLSQLILAQSYKLDRVVDWIGLLESKVYFILFPPPDESAKERQALDFQRRTEEIRSGFEAISKQEFQLRSTIQQNLSSSAPLRPGTR